MGISLSHNKYEEIKKIIVNLFSKYNVTCVPVNGFELATKMGVKIIPYSAIPLAKRYLLLKKANTGLDDPHAIADVFEVSLEAARYALSYYKKWLQHGSDDYTDYEVKLLHLFETA